MKNWQEQVDKFVDRLDYKDVFKHMGDSISGVIEWGKE